MIVFPNVSENQLKERSLTEYYTSIYFFTNCMLSTFTSKYYDCAKTSNCVLVPPSISGSELPSEVGVLLNESIQLVCQAKGIPTPTIQWLKDGGVINNVSSTGLR